MSLVLAVLLLQEEALLDTLGEEESFWELRFSATNRSVACVVHRMGRELVRFNGTAGEEFDFVDAEYNFHFSPDEKRVAYCANNGGHRKGRNLEDGEWFVVSGRSKSGPHQGTSLKGIQPDGSVIYLAKDRDGYSIVSRGKRGEAFEGIDSLSFSSFGEAAYAGVKNGKRHVIRGEKPEGAFEYVGRTHFSADGGTLAYFAYEARKRCLVVNGRRWEAFESERIWTDDLAISADGKTVACVAEAKDAEYVMVNNKKGKSFDRVMDLRMSADGRGVAYRARVGDRWCAVLNERCSEMFEHVEEPALSPDGSRIAFVVDSDPQSVIVEDRKIPTGGKIEFGRIVFSPNGKTAACVVTKDEKRHVRIEDRPGESFDGIGPLAWVGNDQVAFKAQIGKAWYLVVGEEKVGPFDSLLNEGFIAWNDVPVVSPDGKHVAVTARKGAERFIVIDGRKSDSYERVWNPVFATDGSKLVFGAMKGRKIWRKVLLLK